MATSAEMERSPRDTGGRKSKRARDPKSLKNESAGFVTVAALCQLIFLGCFTQVTYGEAVEIKQDTQMYTMFIDVSAMIFFGFGFLMTFLRRYGLSSTGLCLLISSFCVEFSILLQGPFDQEIFDGFGHVELLTILHGLFCAAAVMISMGAVLGKVTPLQLLCMAIVECVGFWASWYMYYKWIKAHDVAGGVVIHTFGAYFGIACSWWFGPFEEHQDLEAIYSSDLFSLSGTFWLFILWPSFCGAVAVPGADQNRAVIHTFIALCGSSMGYAVASRLFNEGRFDQVGLQNATLAGGVIMGCVCDMKMGIWAALLAGLVGGFVSSVGFTFDSSRKFFKCQDVCGVNNLHGMPGLLSAILGFIVIGVLPEEELGGKEVGLQALGLVASLLLALVLGACTGGVLKLLPSLDDRTAFNDSAHFQVANDYELGFE